MTSYLEDLQAEIARWGPRAVARAGDLDRKTVRRFLADPMNTRISTLSRLSRAVGMPVGPIHLVDVDTEQCITCTDPGDAHYPLLPEADVDSYDLRVAEIMEEHGWLIQGVAPRVDAAREDGDVFSYTVGLMKWHHPEFIIFGLPPVAAAAILNALGREVRNGRVYETGRHDEILVGYPAELVEVTDSTEHLTMANRVFADRRPVPALQIVWPDRHGRFPWEDDYSVSPSAQPVLGPR